jgi:orotidine-5'-phosphate decarboxylase
MNSIDVRDRLAIALDVPDLDHAAALAKEVSPFVGVAKVGLELYSAAGPEAIACLKALDFSVFADLKFHDIPTTVRRAARVVGTQGVAYLNMHAAGGLDMIKAGVDGLLDGAHAAGHPAPTPIAVTVLTSDPDTSAFETRLTCAIDGGCGGVVCSVHEVERVHAARPDFVTIVPGIRFDDASRHDQARVGTPEDAARVRADVLVLGRTITESPDPRAAAERAHASFANALTNALGGH